MQSLDVASTSGEASASQAARAMLDVVPPVIRRIRRLMCGERLQGLSVPQFRTLVLLSRCPEASLSAVADQIGSSLPAASRMMDGLVAKGWIQRQQSAGDRRCVSLELTERGRLAIQNSWNHTQRELAGMLQGLGTAECQRVVESMAILAGIFGSDARGEGERDTQTKGKPAMDSKSSDPDSLVIIPRISSAESQAPARAERAVGQSDLSEAGFLVD